MSLLEETLAAAHADAETVRADGSSLRRLTEGVTPRPAIRHIDNRGSVVEVFDARWNWHTAPVSFVYSFTIRPGVVKGWGLHQHHDDRYFLLTGEVELVLYDVRPESPTCGQISKIYMSERTPQLVNIPARVWHADRNIGTTEAVVLNMPTEPYNHAAPDKVKLPVGTPLIPHDFGPVEGG
ncbi:MAG: dTDP-4-dehydrorhamnose 3,5-epimerase family protein [Paracoccaceae bacterium]